MNLICINCPIGCRMNIKKNKIGKLEINGNACKRGVAYATDEYMDPKRMVTTSVKVISGRYPLVSVKTNKPVKKKNIDNLLKELKHLEIEAPIKIGEVIAENFEVSIVATRNVEKESADAQ